MPENISEHMADYSIAMVTGNFIPWLSNTITTANMVNNIYDDVKDYCSVIDVIKINNENQIKMKSERLIWSLLMEK